MTKLQQSLITTSVTNWLSTTIRSPVVVPFSKGVATVVPKTVTCIRMNSTTTTIRIVSYDRLLYDNFYYQQQQQQQTIEIWRRVHKSYYHYQKQKRLYSMAITREIPDCFMNALSLINMDDTQKDHDNVCMQKAREQHESYIRTLRQFMPVLCLPSSTEHINNNKQQHPDCCFVEDTAVVVDNIAVITRPGHISRRKETIDIKQILQQLGYGSSSSTIAPTTSFPTSRTPTDTGGTILTNDSTTKRLERKKYNEYLLFDMNETHLENDDQDSTTITSTTTSTTILPTCDGGDVLHIPGTRHIFVGLSNRTNIQGVQYLRDTFEPYQYEVIMIPPVLQQQQLKQQDRNVSTTAVTNNNDTTGSTSHILHLKTAVTYFHLNTILIPTGYYGDQILNVVPFHDLYGYDVVRVPDLLSCNVVSCPEHNTVLVQDTSCSQSRNILETTAIERNVNIEYVNTSELAKKDAALTCCSILLS